MYLFSIPICGKMKDELGSTCMTKFIGLRPKLYTFEYVDKYGQTHGKSTAKGVQKSMKKLLTVKRYERCLRNMCTESIVMNSIRSDHHKIYTYNINKIGLSAYDDKRYILNNGISTLAHGHYNTKM